MSTAHRLNNTDMGLEEISSSVPIFSTEVPHEMVWLSTRLSEVTGGESFFSFVRFVEISSSVCLSVAYNQRQNNKLEFK